MEYESVVEQTDAFWDNKVFYCKHMRRILQSVELITGIIRS